MAGDTGDGLRIDKWLWFVRFYKTRSLASTAVKGGHVRINGERPKPGARVCVGDRVGIIRGQLPYDITVALLPHRRGPAAEASACYVESDASLTERQTIKNRLRIDRLHMPTTAGRPDKRTRRALRTRNRRPDSQ